MIEFKLHEQEFIQLNNLLKLLQWVHSGGEANQCIAEGMVLVNNNIETQKRKKLRKGDKIEFQKNIVIIQ